MMAHKPHCFGDGSRQKLSLMPPEIALSYYIKQSSTVVVGVIFHLSRPYCSVTSRNVSIHGQHIHLFTFLSANFNQN